LFGFVWLVLIEIPHDAPATSSVPMSDFVWLVLIEIPHDAPAASSVPMSGFVCLLLIEIPHDAPATSSISLVSSKAAKAVEDMSMLWKSVGQGTEARS
jgi:hypothetical protein